MPKNDLHPDLMFYYSYGNKTETIHIRIVSCANEDFPHGLGLENTFSGPDKEKAAELFAIKVQKLLDTMKQAGC